MNCLVCKNCKIKKENLICRTCYIDYNKNGLSTKYNITGTKRSMIKERIEYFNKQNIALDRFHLFFYMIHLLIEFKTLLEETEYVNHNIVLHYNYQDKIIIYATYYEKFDFYELLYNITKTLETYIIYIQLVMDMIILIDFYLLLK